MRVDGRRKHRTSIYDNIQQVFGTDAIGRFILMCTHADGRVCFVSQTNLPHLSFFCGSAIAILPSTTLPSASHLRPKGTSKSGDKDVLGRFNAEHWTILGMGHGCDADTRVHEGLRDHCGNQAHPGRHANLDQTGKVL